VNNGMCAHLRRAQTVSKSDAAHCQLLEVPQPLLASAAALFAGGAAVHNSILLYGSGVAYR
jgi:hypothetical protein